MYSMSHNPNGHTVYRSLTQYVQLREATMGNSEEERKDDRINNAFLSSMTFASGTVTRNCDCDECGLIPIPIANAIRQHKRRRNTTLTRTQDRSLVARADDLSVWKLTMPLHAEPLVEFGNSHRIVLIDTLSSVSIAQKKQGTYCTTFMSRQMQIHDSCLVPAAIESHVDWKGHHWVQ
jgi:hypothetical protein